MKKPLVAFLNVVEALGANLEDDVAAEHYVLTTVPGSDPLQQVLPPIPYGTKVSVLQIPYAAEVSQVAFLDAAAEVITPSTRYTVKVTEMFGDVGTFTPKTSIYSYTSPAVLSGNAATDLTNVLTVLKLKVDAHEAAVVDATGGITTLTLTDKPGYWVTSKSRGGFTEMSIEGFTASQVAITVDGVYALGEGSLLAEQYPQYNRAVTDLEHGWDHLQSAFGVPDAALTYDIIVVKFGGANRDHRAAEIEQYHNEHVVYANNATPADVTALVDAYNAMV